MPGPPVIYRPSGRYWVAWQKLYFPTSTKTSDLRGQFRTGVEAFIKALQAAGVTVKIDETYRSKQAHYLFRCRTKSRIGVRVRRIRRRLPGSTFSGITESHRAAYEVRRRW